MAVFQKLASAIYNDIVSGLRGYHSNISMSLEQLEDDIVNTRLQVIKEYSLKGILPIKDLLVSINCIKIDCKDLDRCKCNSTYMGNPVAHFQIPQLLNDYGQQSIDYIGSTDRQNSFMWYTSSNVGFKYSKYRKRGKDKPFVYIDTTPNEDGMYDCFIFNSLLLKEISISAIFKDPRQIEQFYCCSEYSDDNLNFINKEVQDRVTKTKIYYYRQLAAPIISNNQEYSEG